jgi:hypothetical protein
VDAKTGVKQATIEVTILRANGDRENLGVVSYWHKNPLRRLAWRLGWRR